MANRVSQVGVEALVTGQTTAVRVSQVGVEALVTGQVTNARVSQLAVEVLYQRLVIGTAVGTGGLDFGGAALTEWTKYFDYVPSGGFTFAGDALTEIVATPDVVYEYTGSGGFTFAGAAVTKKAFTRYGAHTSEAWGEAWFEAKGSWLPITCVCSDIDPDAATAGTVIGFDGPTAF